MLSWFRNKRKELDELERKHLVQFERQYPKMPKEQLIKMAKQKATWEKDTERIRPEDIRNLITELNLPPIIRHLFDETADAKQYSLSNDYRCPSEFFLMTKAEQDHYDVDHIRPILSDSNFYSIYAYDLERQGFLKYHIEDSVISNERYQWEGIFIRDILMWWEAEISENEIVNKGQLMGLDHINEILESLMSEFDNSTFEKVNAWEQHILEKFELKIPL